MAYRVEFTSSAIAELGKVSKEVQKRVLRKVRWLGENFDAVTPQPLAANLKGLFKLRVGDYRVIYSWDSDSQCITIHKVGHRRDIYTD
ncbi:MAG: type II toxin-antitoxin system RelE family toxin [Spirulinaceae cyanobacterium]